MSLDSCQLEEVSAASTQQDSHGGEASAPQDGGEVSAARNWFPLIYNELRALAQHQLNAESPGLTLQATALVHEAYLRLSKHEGSAWGSRTYFFGAAAEAMRRILVDHARRHSAIKRGRDWTRCLTRLDDLTLSQDWGALVALDESLNRLAAVEPQAAEVVKLRFFAGMSVDQTAEVAGISPRSVDRAWAFARAWLLRDLRGSGIKDQGKMEKAHDS
ncbi:MAG: ECF-type sigma factor [Phycisphaerales bacterium]|nr:ECF-type sigma factor [Phycisphaerales bacterium]MCI0676746.1 ECF-type sigma factor [Phycisphaerales bacterium]